MTGKRVSRTSRRLFAYLCAGAALSCSARHPRAQPSAALDETPSQRFASNPGNSKTVDDGQSRTSEALRQASGGSEQMPFGDARFDLGEASRVFGTALYRQLAPIQPGNFAFSPIGLHMPLAIVAAGARGETARQIQVALALRGPPDDVHKGFSAQLQRARELSDGHTTLDVANRLYADEQLSVQHTFLDLAEHSYGSPLERLNMTDKGAAARRINSWVKDSTHSHIRELLSPDALNRAGLVVANAIYFEGQWLHPFPVRATKPDDFQLADGTAVRVPMMQLERKEFRQAVVDGLQVLELPYRNDQLSIVFLIPGGKLVEFEKTFTGELIQRSIAALALARLDFVKLPRFRVEPAATITLRQPLSDLGMPVAFTRQADFSGIAPQTYVHDVYHRAVVRVDEHGTVAAAGSAVVMRWVRDGSSSVVVNRPFVFFIRDQKTGALLFLGRILDPRAG